MAARSDHTLGKENMEKAAIILSQVTFVSITAQKTEDLPQDLQIREGRQMSLLNSLKRNAAQTLQSEVPLW